jgi:hypothetical protein
VKVNYESRLAGQRKDKREDRKKNGKEQPLFPDSTVRKHDFQYLVPSACVHTKIISAPSSTDDHSIGEL